MNTADIIDFWFPSEETKTHAFWFDGSKDEEIRTRFSHLVNSITMDNYVSFIHSPLDELALLVIGDQFTRNVYRNLDQAKKNDEWALNIALSMLDRNIDLSFPLHYRFFVLLPLRHAKQSYLLHRAVERIQLYRTEYTTPSLEKFYHHSIQNYATLTDEIVKSKFGIIQDYESILEKPISSISESTKVHHCLSSRFKKISRVAVSLSGGVDSMCLLAELTKTCHVVAIHVEYINRPESRMEREYLEWYCNKLNIHLYYRTIHYLKRDEQRELFETESRRARFELYKYVVEHERLEGVCLGHHKGDVVENVLTNLIRGRDPSDMTVMREQQLMDGVQLFRPLLSLTKDDIYDYAHSHGIRYFLNSTPSWSCRGVLRDTVLPELKNQFGEFESNVIAFAEKCSFYANEYESLINQQRQPISNAYGTRVVHTGKEWNALVMNIMHGYGYAMASKKSIKLMLHWLDGKRNAMFQLSKDVVVCAQDKYLYFINHTLFKKDKLVSFELFPELGTSLLKRLL